MVVAAKWLLAVEAVGTTAVFALLTGLGFTGAPDRGAPEAGYGGVIDGLASDRWCCGVVVPSGSVGGGFRERLFGILVLCVFRLR